MINKKEKPTKKQRMNCLINPTEEERINREPLLLFSFYLSVKNNLLLKTLDDIIENLDNGFSDDLVRGGDNRRGVNVNLVLDIRCL